MTLTWTIILVMAIIIEAITIDLVSIWFSVGALAALIADVFFKASQTMQIILFIVISIVCIVASRPLAKKYLRGNTVRTNYDRIIGKHCVVIKTITEDKKGQIEISGNVWSATSLNNIVIEEDKRAQILSIEGAHVVVKEIE